MADETMDGSSDKADTLKDSAAIAVSLLAFTAFGVFIIFLLSRLDIVEPQWTRAIYLLNGIEAIVFAAAGFLFGKEVHRSQAVSAERRASAAESVAKQKTEEAERGRALAATILAKDSSRQPRFKIFAGTTEVEDSEVAKEVTETSQEVTEMAQVARRLFPDV